MPPNKRANSGQYLRPRLFEKTYCKQIQIVDGAGEGNRTLVCSLGSCRSTIELRPQHLILLTTRTGSIFRSAFGRSKQSSIGPARHRGDSYTSFASVGSGPSAAARSHGVLRL